jgi:hypothetical protein
MIQLTETIPVETPLGSGTAILFRPGEHDNSWTVILEETGAFVDFPQREIRACRSYYPRVRMTTEEMKEIIK